LYVYMVFFFHLYIFVSPGNKKKKIKIISTTNYWHYEVIEMVNSCISGNNRKTVHISIYVQSVKCLGLGLRFAKLMRAQVLSISSYDEPRSWLGLNFGTRHSQEITHECTEEVTTVDIYRSCFGFETCRYYIVD
jgi:hypothetical protein